MGSIKMDSKKKETARVYKQQQIAPGIYDMWITTDRKSTRLNSSH